MQRELKHREELVKLMKELERTSEDPIERAWARFEQTVTVAFSDWLHTEQDLHNSTFNAVTHATLTGFGTILATMAGMIKGDKPTIIKTMLFQLTEEIITSSAYHKKPTVQ